MRDALGQISTENCKTKNKTKMSCSNRSLWELVGKYLTFCFVAFGAADLSLETAPRLRRCLAKGCRKNVGV